MRSPTRPSTRACTLAGTVVALFLAGFLSYYASSSPDGLERVSGEILPGIAAQEREHTQGDAALADYSTEGIVNDRLSGASAGVVGVTVTLTVGGLLFVAVRGRRSGSTDSADRTASSAGQAER